MSHVLVNLPLDIRKYISKFLARYDPKKHSIYELIRTDNVDGLKFLWKYKRTLFSKHDKLLWWSLGLGSLGSLEFIYGKYISGEYVESDQYDVWEHGLYFAITSGRLDIVKWFREHDLMYSSGKVNPVTCLVNRLRIRQNIHRPLESQKLATLSYLYNHAIHMISPDIDMFMKNNNFIPI